MSLASRGNDHWPDRRNDQHDDGRIPHDTTAEITIPESWIRRHPVYRAMKERLRAQITELQNREPSDYAIRRSKPYRTMKARHLAVIEELKQQNARLRHGHIGELKAAEVRALPLFQQLRDRHNDLKEKNQELRRELGSAMPTKYAIERSEPYRSLRERYQALLNDVRDATKIARANNWAAESNGHLRDELRWAQQTINRFLPEWLGSDPKRATYWHLQEAARFAAAADISLFALGAALRNIQADGGDPTQGLRARNGHVPAAVRRDLLHEEAACVCGRTDDLTIDHIVPIAAGGKSNPENLQVLCRRCNSKKGAKVGLA